MQEINRAMTEANKSSQFKGEDHDSLNYDSVMSQTLQHENSKWADPMRTTSKFFKSTERNHSKPYTARVVAPVMVGDLQKYSTRNNVDEIT
jgi:hypothetical protein